MTLIRHVEFLKNFYGFRRPQKLKDNQPSVRVEFFPGIGDVHGMYFVEDFFQTFIIAFFYGNNHLRIKQRPGLYLFFAGVHIQLGSFWILLIFIFFTRLLSASTISMSRFSHETRAPARGISPKMPVTHPPTVE